MQFRVGVSTGIRNRQELLAERSSGFALARQQLSDTVLSAPIDGAVRERRASVGEYLTAGAPVFGLVRVHPLRLRVAVPERDAPSGDRVEILKGIAAGEQVVAVPGNLVGGTPVTVTR